MSDKTLYQRLGGYDAIAAVAGDLLPRLQGDPQLGRFWDNRGDDGVAREGQLLVDFLCYSAGGPMECRHRKYQITIRDVGDRRRAWRAHLHDCFGAGRFG